jgi:hypothetical protein
MEPLPLPPATLNPKTLSDAPPPQPKSGGVAQTIGSAGVSLLFHAFMILLLGLATWAIGGTIEPSDSEFKVHVVSATESTAPGGGFQFPGNAFIDRPDSAKAAEFKDASADLAELLKQEQPPVEANPAPTGAGLAEAGGELRRGDVVGVGLDGLSKGGGQGTGLGDRDLAGGGPVGSLWGVGEGQRARSIVYVMDRSGSMSDTFGLLQRELKRAIGSLERDQLFEVIWFNEGKPTELFSRMKPASLANKQHAFAAIGRIVPSGQTEPVVAIRLGLGYKPDVLFLLSDGDFGEENKNIIRTIRQFNKNRVTTINTILFVYDTMGEGERVLRAIAESSGGVYKHVTEEDVRQ